MRKALGLTLGLWALGLGLCGGELGARISWDEGTSGLGWLALSWELGDVSLTGRGELDLFPVRGRLLYLGATLEQDCFSLSGTTKLLGTGRLDVSAAGELTPSASLGAWGLEGNLGLRVSLAAVLSARMPLAAAWAAVRGEKPPFWGSIRGEAPLTGGTPTVQLDLGLDDDGWTALHLYLLGASLASAALELGASEEGLSGSFFLTLYPRGSGMALLQLGEEPWQLTLRLRTAWGGWSGTASLTGQLSTLQFKLAAQLTRRGLEEASLELSLSLGD
ncbi:hypothetical protein H5T52_07645 [Candidatus Bipolaricaulota bacterium]|nr:hypothetical protein [Candidatus Bipolaricaulota bacterium]